MDPGRRAIEEREAAFLSVGDRILTDHGREYEVISWTAPDSDSRMEFTVMTVHGETVVQMTLGADETVRARVRPSGN